MDKKIINAIYALYGGAVIGLVTTFANLLQIQHIQSGIEIDPFLPPLWAISFAVFPSLILVATYFVAQELKAKKKWSWISALVLFALNSTGISILFSIFGIIQLCDREVREYFLKRMEISLD